KQSTVPAFVSKLWALVEAPSTNDLICWSLDCCSFLVQDEQQFSKEVLPLYFKHSNMTSFVRQLNMYGFHKVVHVDAGLAKSDRQIDHVEFQHENIRNGQPLLGLIRRKVSVSRASEDGGQVSQVLVQISHAGKTPQTSNSWLCASELFSETVNKPSVDNECLCRELDSLRQKYQQQHKIIRKIIKYISNSVQTNRIKGCKRRLPMIDKPGEFQSAPKYSRSFSVNSTHSTSSLHEIPSLQELDVSPADVYTNGRVISDITCLLDSTPEPHNLAAISPCSPLSPDLDNFSKKQQAQSEADTLPYADTGTHIRPRFPHTHKTHSPVRAYKTTNLTLLTWQRPLQQDWNRLEQELCDGGECSDILPSRLLGSS
ncbi:putative heat shock factor protein 1-like, partial [Triplophysa rosa]